MKQRKEVWLVAALAMPATLWGCGDGAAARADSRAGDVGERVTAAVSPRQRVLDFLHGISGSRTLVGVENKDTSHPTSDSDQVASIAGKQSSFWGADFGFGSGAVNNRSTMIGEAEAQWAAGAVVGLMYHACAPTGDEFCSWDDIGGAHPAHLTDAQWSDLVTPGTQLYHAWIARLDTLAVYFQQLKNAGVAALFRPLHEMNQCVFWWSCHTGPKGSAELYRITHDYLTNTKGLDNIVWVWNVQDFTSLGSDVDTYNPGTSFFDIAALDVYNTGYTQNNYNAMLGAAGGKPIAIAECQFMPTSSLLAQQSKWLYAMLWPDFISNNQNTLSALYHASNVVTLDQMPGWQASSAGGPITGLAGKCADVRSSGTANGTPIQIFSCNGTAAQQWSSGADGTLRALGKCMDVTSSGTADGTKVQLYDCNGTGAQQWTASGGQLVNPNSGKCLDATGQSSADGTPLQVWTCTGNSNQQWRLP